MSRRRDLSTDISTDKKMKRLSDFAALLYTWMIPHAGDDCRITGAKDPEEINLLVVPNRRKADEEVAAAIDELLDAKLIGQDADGRYFFPAESFYKYQTRVPVEKRVKTPAPGRHSTAKTPSLGENTEEHRRAALSPEIAVLPSPSPSPSPSEVAAPDAAPVDNSEHAVKDAVPGNPYQSMERLVVTPVPIGPALELAAEIAGKDDGRMRELCKFAQKTFRECIHFGDSPEAAADAILHTFRSLKAKAEKDGRPIDAALLWPYLQQTHKFRRTTALQSESAKFKTAPVGSFGEIMDQVRAARDQ